MVQRMSKGKDKLPGQLLKKNPAKHPIDMNKQAKKGGKINRNKIGQVC